LIWVKYDGQKRRADEQISIEQPPISPARVNVLCAVVLWDGSTPWQSGRLLALWGGLVLVILWWVPQDIFISLQRDAWLHVWVDMLAAIILVVPLVWLWKLDRTWGQGQ